jgi:hypothetical protein
MCWDVKQVHVYSGGGHCAAFLANIDTSDVTVQFEGVSYDLPAWSVSILPDCKSAVFNTAKVRDVDASSIHRGRFWKWLHLFFQERDHFNQSDSRNTERPHAVCTSNRWEHRVWQWACKVPFPLLTGYHQMSHWVLGGTHSPRMRSWNRLPRPRTPQIICGTWQSKDFGLDSSRLSNFLHWSLCLVIWAHRFSSDDFRSWFTYANVLWCHASPGRNMSSVWALVETVCRLQRVMSQPIVQLRRH